MILVKVDPRGVQAEFSSFRKDQVPFALALALTWAAKAGQKAFTEALPGTFDRPTPRTVGATRVEVATKRNLVASVAVKDEASKGTPPEKYLRPEVEGGVRRQKGSERILQQAGLLPGGWQMVPGSAAPLDAYGNIPGPYMVRLLAILRAYRMSGFTANETDATEAKRKKRLRKQGKNAVDYFVHSPIRNHGPKEGRGRLPLGIWERNEFKWGSSIRPILLFIKPGSYEKRLPFFALVRSAMEDSLPDDLRRAMNQAAQSAK